MAERGRTTTDLPKQETTLAVQGMTCQGCAGSVNEALQEVRGVDSAEVSLDREQARVRWEPEAQTDNEALVAAVQAAGYQAAVAENKTELAISGMTCQGCVRAVTEALQEIEGVATAAVDLDRQSATVRWRSPAEADADSLIAAVRQAGYEATVRGGLVGSAEEENRRSRWSPFAGWQFNVVVGSAVTAFLMVAEWAFQVGMERWYQWLSFFLVLPVQAICGARFYRGAWLQLKVGRSNMDTLVALGSTTAFLYSAWGLFAGWDVHLYFMEPAAIITLISIGHWLESKASARAAGALRALLNLAPESARKLDVQGAEQEVPVNRLRVDDRIVLKPGDRIPTDATVLEGESAVDESMLTGESIPVDKSEGTNLYAGTVNRNGRLIAQVSATGEATSLAHIIAIVQRAQTSRAAIQRLGDKVSNVFVPIVVAIALLTGLWWGLAPESARAVSATIEPWLWTPFEPAGALASAIYHVAAVLIIACPCAMGLATPAAIMAGTNAAAARGILIRDGIALEKTGQITAVMFDKTGTLTEGKMTVAAVKAVAGSDESDIVKVAASLANRSNHPLSRAVAEQCEQYLPVADWREHAGAGVEGKVREKGTYRLGSLNWLQKQGVDSTPGRDFVEKRSAEGATLLGLALEQQLIGLVALHDSIKPDAADIVAYLNKKNKQVWLVTGDSQRTAEAIADQVGINPENVFSAVRPEEKANVVGELQKRGLRVAFVGDGINDAPALEQADLGVAVSKATDVAREAADIILLNSDIHAVPEALGLAQATLRTIKQNLFWAFFYNAAAIPLAVLGFLSPILSAMAMALSDFVVIGNAIRLRRWKP